MKIRLFNSLTRKVEDFRPVDDNLVRIYSCGPTVYNYAHIGNMRAFLFADLLQRVIRIVGGYDVRWVMNITNIDDKTIRGSSFNSPAWLTEMGRQTKDPKENLRLFTEYYENEFISDIKKLGVKTEDFFALPRATDFIPHIQELIKKIYDNGYAYVSDGSVYFDVSKWRQTDLYGKLHKIDFENFRHGVRIDADQYDREQVSDFVLWKAKKENEPSWDYLLDSMNCDGRPGWHIECSTMEYEMLGLPFDIHTGGIDLKFPHHEDEIAQSKAGYGKEPTVYWCHNEFLEVEGEKMSKSRGNFYTLRDLLHKYIDPLDLRYSMLASHYGSIFNFTFDGLKSATKARARIQEYIYQLFDKKHGSSHYDVNMLKDKVFAELANDLHTPKALAHLFTFINENQPEKLASETKQELIEFFESLNHIFEVWDIEAKSKVANNIPHKIKELADRRIEAKKARNWELADEIRDEILNSGFVIKDTKDSYILEKKK